MTEAAGLASRLWRKLFTLEQWRIGVADIPVKQFLSAPERAHFRWIGGTRRREILADPFAIEKDGRVEILAERLVYGETRGTLVKIAFDGDRTCVTAHGDKPFHLSYPFTLRDDGAMFVVPEQAQSGHLAIYSLAETMPGTPVSTIEGLDAIDPTFVHHHGLWWLFCSRLSDRPNGALHLFYAEKLAGPYTAHPKNPVVIDARRARPAGRILVEEDRLIRPGQDCEKTYGGAISLCAIEVLSPTEYRETVIAKLTPQMIEGAWPDGVHTLEHTAQSVLIDTKRFVFHPLAWVFKAIDRRAGRFV